MEKYKKLQRMFRKYGKNIKSNSGRQIYYDGTNSKVNNERGTILGCKRIIDQAKIYEIPENVLLSVPHPELFPYIETQCCTDSCSTASIRTRILLKYGKKIDEPSLWEMNSYRKVKRLRGNGLINDGLGPAEVAEVIKNVENKFFKNEVKLFSTTNGTISQLETYLANKEFPMIVRPWGYAPWEVGGLDTHYELVWAVDGENVYLCNSENGARNMGLHSFGHEDFLEWWAYGHEGLGKNKNTHYERWYAVPVPKNDKLPKDFFKGKYL